MCIAIPGKIIEIGADKKVATIDFSGVKQVVRLDLLGELDDGHIGNYVLVHVGYAIQLMTQQEAEETLKVFHEYADAMEKELQGKST
ncbi:MAG: HypC/HybG/HupF family hydrogenase formation chaperone [Methanocellales archaeon]|nr:HypC/HybG/HupF family hydrogenase formation chaperone [Methanocellales archaeon]